MKERMNFLDLQWHKPDKPYGKSKADVSILSQKNNHIGFTLRNGCWKKMAVSGACGRIEFAIFNENVIVFRMSKDGYKLTIPADGNAYFKVSFKNNLDILQKLTSFVGDYPLLYEKNFNLWYISKNTKE